MRTHVFLVTSECAMNFFDLKIEIKIGNIITREMFNICDEIATVSIRVLNYCDDDDDGGDDVSYRKH